ARDLVAYRRVPCVQVRLKIVEAMKVVLLRLLVVGPRRLLHAGKDDTLLVIRRALVGPDVPIARRRLRIAPRALKPLMLVGRVVDDEIDDDAEAERPRVVHELD